jgi:uncharacterized protein YkwD
MAKRLILLLALLASGLAPAVAQKNDARGARELAELVNRERERAGLRELAWSDRLAEAAEAHARAMAERRQISHQFAGEAPLRERVVVTGLRFNDVGENVAFDEGVESAHADLMRSPGHRANILKERYNALGIGIVWRGDRLYVVEDFARTMPEYSDAQAVARVEESFNRQRHGYGLNKVAWGHELHEAACHMADMDRVSSAGVSAPGATNIITFTAFEPEDLPASVRERAGEPGLGRVAIGACFARTPSYPSGVHWVVMVFYP